MLTLCFTESADLHFPQAYLHPLTFLSLSFCITNSWSPRTSAFFFNDFFPFFFWRKTKALPCFTLLCNSLLLYFLRYYYAVVECDSSATADYIYKACDRLEFELSSNVLDLRFIPDDMEFKHPPRDIATEVTCRTTICLLRYYVIWCIFVFLRWVF